MNKDEVLRLAKLARIEIGDDEAESLSHEFDAILNYVGEIKSAGKSLKEFGDELHPIRNVLREDVEPHESGIYTESILNEAPKRSGDYVEVKKIL